MITKLKIFGGVLLFISLLGYLYYNEIINHGSTKKELASVQTELLNIKEKISKLDKDRVEVETKLSSIVLDVNKDIRELESFKGRESVLMAKPGLVEIKINKSFSSTQQQLACATGDINLCQK